jgi:hypothetical protein
LQGQGDDSTSQLQFIQIKHRMYIIDERIILRWNMEQWWNCVNLSEQLLVHHKAHTDWPDIEPSSPL